MANPFAGRGPWSTTATDLVPVTPDDNTDLADVAVGLRIETGGTIAVITAAGNARSYTVTDGERLEVGIRRVKATGTTATGIQAYVVN